MKYIVIVISEPLIEKEGEYLFDEFDSERPDCHCANCRPDLFIGTDLEVTE